MSEQAIIDYLAQFKNNDKAVHSARFFKTAPGEYGAGDVFWGLNVPTVRQAVKHFKNTSLEQALILLKHPVHEIRLFAVLTLVSIYQRGNEQQKKQVFQAYLAQSHHVNNWDLVDSSAHKIVGAYLLDKDKTLLFSLANAENLWCRRIAMMATYTFIKAQHYQSTLALAVKLLDDKEDLIHKIVGWMLREIGKQDLKVLIDFLEQYAVKMPRTMLRYAIEKLAQEQRQYYLSI